MALAGSRPLIRYGPIPVPIDDLEFLRRNAAATDSSVNREIRRALKLYRASIERRQGVERPLSAVPDPPTPG